MVDGASRTQTLVHVIFPFLRPLVLFVLIIRSMDAFRIFDQVFVMTGGGPGTTTQTITFYNYVMAFRMLRMGRASALGVVTLLILSVVIGVLDLPPVPAGEGRMVSRRRRIGPQVIVARALLYLALLGRGGGVPVPDLLRAHDVAQGHPRGVHHPADVGVHADARAPPLHLAGDAVPALPRQHAHHHDGSGAALDPARLHGGVLPRPVPEPADPGPPLHAPGRPRVPADPPAGAVLPAGPGRGALRHAHPHHPDHRGLQPAVRDLADARVLPRACRGSSPRRR